MLNIRIQDCENCGEIGSVLCKLDLGIQKLAMQEYNAITYLAPPPSRILLKRMLYYKSILNNLYWNANYYCVSFKDILSRVKSLLNGL